MSWSKIIRKGGQQHRPYTLEPLGGPLPDPDQDGFRVLRFEGENVEEPEAPVAEEPPAPPPCIPEEEALIRIRQAREEGLQLGREQAQAELAAAGEALGHALVEAGGLRAQLMHDAEEDLLKLSVLIARKVMLRELTCDPGILAGMVQAALDLTSESGEIVVLLNPEEHALVSEIREFRELVRVKPSLTLKGDPAVGRAGCLVQTARGTIDAGMDAQLEEIMRKLHDERSARREEPADD